MATQIRMTFLTDRGTSRTLRVPHANPAISDAMVRTIMGNVQSLNILPGVVGRRNAALVEITTQAITIA